MNARLLAGVLVLLGVSLAVGADPIRVGSGENVAYSVINFDDGANYTFEVYFDGTTTGLGLFDIIEANSDLSTDRQNFGFGIFINGITFEGHSNIGYAGGENWWHYWTKDSEEASWTSPFIGAGDRVVPNGGSDGWVYGRAGAPLPEPAGLMLLALGSLLLHRRHRGARAS